MENKENKENKYKIIFVIGPPGVGKNTQCDKLVKKYNFIHFSTGDLLRAEISKNTENGSLIKSIMSQGKLVPVNITCNLIKNAMDNYSKDNIFLIDGYPRNKENIDGWNEIFGDNYILITSIILDCDETILKKRLVGRGRKYGRIDDNINTIKKRFETHIKESKPIENKLKTMGPFIEIKSTGSINEVFNKIVSKLDIILQKYQI